MGLGSHTVRMCSILQVPLRDDDPGTKIRVAAEDVAGHLVKGKPIEPGLHFCSEEAYQEFAPRVIERLKKTEARGHDGKPVFTDDTFATRAMVLPETATVANTPRQMLC